MYRCVHILKDSCSPSNLFLVKINQMIMLSYLSRTIFRSTREALNTLPHKAYSHYYVYCSEISFWITLYFSLNLTLKIHNTAVYSMYYLVILDVLGR